MLPIDYTVQYAALINTLNKIFLYIPAMVKEPYQTGMNIKLKICIHND